MIAAAPIAAGWFTQSGATVTPPPTPGALAAPSLVAAPPVDTLTTRSVLITVAGPASWPIGVTVQLQRQRLPGAFVDDALTATGTTLVLPRESAPYTVRVRGFATNGGSVADSEVSGVLELTVPAALSEVTAGGTPLRWRVRVVPVDTTTTPQTDTLTPTRLPFRAQSPNRVIVDQVEDPERPSRIQPTAMAWRALSAAGDVLGTGSLTNSDGTWRVVLRPSAVMRVLELIATAPDSSTTTVQYHVALGTV